MTYQSANGPVENAPVVYLVFWGVQWQVGWTDVSNSGTTYSSNQSMQYITGFFNYLSTGASSWMAPQTQYCSGVAVGTVNCGSAGTHVGNPPHFGGSWVDTTSPPPPPAVPDNCAVAVCLNGGGVAQQANLIAQEALQAENHFGYSPNASYLIMLPKATATPGYGYYCAYHSEAVDSSGRAISFTNMPYDLDLNTLCGRNFVNATDNAFGNGYMDGYSIVAGHEVGETATDALPGTNPAWRDANGQENGDKCAWGTPGTPGGSYNIGPDSGGHYYAVQTLWSNTANACV
jgi:serine protease